MPAGLPDEGLRPYATEEQWRKLTAYAADGTYIGAARSLGVTPMTLKEGVRAVWKKAAQQGYAPAFDLVHKVPEGLRLKGTSIRYNGAGEVEQYWNKTAVAGRDEPETIQLPDPKRIVKRSTLYDQQGNVSQQWISEKPEDAEREALWEAAAKAMASKLPRAAKIKGPKHANADLCACYPVGDHHTGMLSWDKESGDDWDLSLAEKALMGATDHLVQTAPPCGTALVALLGDYFHYDSFQAVTPTNRNLLDADGRFPKMVRTGIRTARYLIDAAAARHKKVVVIVESGNHDPASTVFLRECLAIVYESNPRVTVDTSPRNCHYFDFGKTLVGTHHGDNIKMERLPLLMASDMPDAWGRTKHRYWWTGHIHHAKSKSMVDQGQDYNGCSVESFRVLCPPDAWAAGKGYRPIRDMKCILLHREFGEVARHTVNPDMF